MRSLVLILLLLNVAVGQFGTTVLVLVRHQRGRRYAEMLRILARGEEEMTRLKHLVVFTAGKNASPLSFVRVGRDEVRYEGHLYDVVHEEQRGDTLHLWGYWDHEEEQAVAQLVQSFEEVVAGIVVASWPVKDLHLVYLSRASVTWRPPFPDSLRYARTHLHTVAAPFYEVPHAPPRDSVAW